MTRGPAFLKALGLAALLGTGAGQIATAQEAAPIDSAPEIAPETDVSQGWRNLFFDEEDGKFDVSNLLARGGFLAMPIIITEPAVDNGLGLTAYFVRNPTSPDGVPTRTILGIARTGNGSNGYGFIRSGAIFDNRWHYKIGAGKGLAVMDFYPGNRDFALTYNNDIEFAMIEARYRVPDSGFSFGPVLRYRSNEVRLDAGDFHPDLKPFEGISIDLPSAGFSAHYDDRDNPFTPTKGMNIWGEVQWFDSAIGSDIDFTSSAFVTTWFKSEGKNTLGMMLDARHVSDNAPFFMMPDINIRGLQRNRLQGDSTLSSEIELRRQLSDRWGVLGFVGYGKTFGNDTSDAVTYGAGVRYRVARKLGLDVGLDYAFGPNQDVFYLQFAHAWSRRMD